MRLSGILGPGVLPGLPELPPCKVGYIMAMIVSFVEYLSTRNAMSLCVFSISPTVGGCGLGGLRSSPPSQGQVHQGAAEVDLDLTRGT